MEERDNVDYTPDWVKTNPRKYKAERYHRQEPIYGRSHLTVRLISRRTKRLLAHFANISRPKTPNALLSGYRLRIEPGIFGSYLDYGMEAQQVFDQAVPAKILTWLKKNGKGPVYDIWQKAGGKESGTWPELFGCGCRRADERLENLGLHRHDDFCIVDPRSSRHSICWRQADHRWHVESWRLAGVLAISIYLFFLVAQLGFIITQLGQAAASADRIFEILDAKSDIVDKPNGIELPSVKGQVNFENVTFRYFHGGDPGLSEVTFEAKPSCDRIALLGATGSGKSTIINLLPRF